MPHNEKQNETSTKASSSSSSSNDSACRLPEYDIYGMNKYRIVVAHRRGGDKNSKTLDDILRNKKCKQLALPLARPLASHPLFHVTGARDGRG